MNTTDTKTTSVSKVANVIIPVDDQDGMLAFYTQKLGLEKRADVPFGDDEGNRWIEVAPSGAETPIALCPRARTEKPAVRTPGSPCRPTTSTLSTRSCGIAASMSTLRSVAWATPCRPCSGCATRRATR